MRWLTYEDSEVTCFHPVCEEALERALQLLGPSDTYKIEHHRAIGALEMDFVITEKKTDTLFCVVEVKRTRSAVESTRYQFQAMSYAQSYASHKNNLFYILTNLETSIFFRYEATRPTPQQQMLAPGCVTIGSFSESKEGFITKLAEYFSCCIQDIRSDHYTYHHPLSRFCEQYAAVRQSEPRRRSFLAVYLYQYLHLIMQQCKRDNFSRDVRNLLTGNGGGLQSLYRVASKVDFDGIFDVCGDGTLQGLSPDNRILRELAACAREFGNSPYLANLLYDAEVPVPPANGEVPTDPELARVVGVLAAFVHGKPIMPEEKICDPAAGSGNLLIESARVLGMTHPGQLVANEVNPAYGVPLSLRLGMYNIHQVNPTDAPTVHLGSLGELEPAFFQNVRIVVLNPPFISGIASVEQKNKLADAMKKRGVRLSTNIGQMPLEAVLLETLLTLLPAGVTVALIIPARHMVSKGKEAAVFRRLLLEKFGLQTVFYYPRKKLFRDVTIGTCVVVGQTGSSASHVHVIRSLAPIPDIAIDNFRKELKKLPARQSEFVSLGDDCEGASFPRELMTRQVKNGWKNFSAAGKMADALLRSCCERSSMLAELHQTVKLKRGNFGNKGGSQFSLDEGKPEYRELLSLPPASYCQTLQNSHIDTQSIELPCGDGISPVKSEATEALLLRLGERILGELKDKKKGKQKKKVVGSVQELLTKALGKLTRFQGNLLLLPRGARAHGRAFVASFPLYVSTNFFVASYTSHEDAVIMATWMSTLLYQTSCFLCGKDEAGMRKLEKKNFELTIVPDIKKLTKEEREIILTAADRVKPVNFKDIHPQEIDDIWGRILFGESAQTVTEEAWDCLTYFVSEAAE